MALNESLQAKVDVIINGEKALATYKDLTNAQRTLAQAFRTTDDPEQKKQLAAAYQKINGHIKDQNDLLKGTGGLWNSISAQVKQFGVLAAGYLGFQALTGQIKNIVSQNAKLSDSFADIQQTTGMSAEEVRVFNSALGKMNTRTATKDLREIAAVAGQLGVSKKDILAFTAATDKLNVALGREFGGNANAVTEVLGKMRNVLTDIKSDKIDEDMLHIGNALLSLGQAGLATAPVVADFANRIGGVGIPLGLTSGQVLGLSATLQELNVSTERGGTAITRILQKMATNVSEFAVIAGMDVQSFTKLVNEDLFGAFKKVVEGSQKAGSSATALSAVMKDAELQGSGASEVFLKLSKNMGLLDDKVKLSGSSLQSTGTIIEGFNLKNETFGAVMDKLGKRLNSLFVSSGFTNGLKSTIGAIAEMLDATTELDRLTNTWREQSAEVSNYETNIVPLIKRYEELKGKTSLTSEEQSELKSIIEKVAAAVPSAISQFDEYGKAMDISSGKAKEFGINLRALNEEKNRDALKETRSNLFDVRNEITELQRALNQKDSEGFLSKTVAETRKVGDEFRTITKEVRLTDREIAALQNRLSQKQTSRTGLEALVNELAGVKIYAEEAKKAVTELKTDSSPGKPSIAAGPDEETVKNTKKFYEELEKLRAEALNDELEKLEAKRRVEYQFRVKEIEETKASANVKRQLLLEEEKKFLSDIEAMRKKAGEDMLKKELAEDLNNLNEWHAKEKLTISQQHAAKQISDEEAKQQEQQLQLKFLALKLFNQKQYGVSTVQTEQEIADLTIKINKEASEEVIKTLKSNFKHATEEQLQHLKNLSDIISKLIASGASPEVLQEALKNYQDYLNTLSAQEPQDAQSGLKKWLDKNLKYFQQFAQSVTGIYGNLNRIANNKSDERLIHEKKNLDKERDFAKWQLDHKILNETQYNAKLKAIDEQEAKAERKAAREKAIRDQKMAIFSASVSSTQAIVTTLAAYPWPFNLVFALAEGVYLATLINAIKSEPLPELGKGAILQGKKHSQGGIPIVAEGGEMVATASFVEKNPELAHAIVEAGQKHDGDLSQVLPYYNSSPPVVNAPRVVETTKVMQQGGYVSSNTGPASQQLQSSNTLVHQFAVMTDAYNKVIEKNSETMDRLSQQLDKGINASLDYRAYKKNKTRYEAIEMNK